MLFLKVKFFINMFFYVREIILVYKGYIYNIIVGNVLLGFFKVYFIVYFVKLFIIILLNIIVIINKRKIRCLFLKIILY